MEIFSRNNVKCGRKKKLLRGKTTLHMSGNRNVKIKISKVINFVGKIVQERSTFKTNKTIINKTQGYAETKHEARVRQRICAVTMMFSLWRRQTRGGVMGPVVEHTEQRPTATVERRPLAPACSHIHYTHSIHTITSYLYILAYYAFCYVLGWSESF